jgi:soluble lytic murein transglycosylase-like protein
MPPSIDYMPTIQSVAADLGVDPYMIYAMMLQESGYEKGVNPKAQSKKGAKGLLQVMPSTYNQMALESGGTLAPYSDMTDPTNSIIAGALYYKKMLNKTGSSREALKEYNAGSKKKRQRSKETQTYLKNVLTNYKMGKAYEAVQADNKAGQEEVRSALYGTHPLSAILGAR